MIDLTTHWTGLACLAIFFVAYGLVIAEEAIEMRKSKPVLLAAGLIWALVAVGYGLVGQAETAHELAKEIILEYGELLLFLLVAPVFGFFVSPLLANLSRKHEFQADAYACQQASGADLSTALLKLHEDNAATLTPDPVYVKFYYSHPPASERLAAMKLQPQ